MTERIILKNGKIFTADEKNPWAEMAVICGGIFEKVGKNSEAGPQIDAGTKVIDLQDRTVLPGFIDSHTHIGLSVMMGGEDDSMPIWDCKSKAEILSKLRQHVKNHPFRLYYAAFFGQVEALCGEMLAREDLDKIVKRRPVILMEQECHSAWLNSGAMKFMKLHEDIEDIAPGYSYYERDAKGRLTGCIKEMTMLPLLSMAGGVSRKEMKAGILKIADYLLDHGVTTVYDAGNYFREEETYRLLADMDLRGELPIRWEAAYIITTPDKADTAIDELKRYKSLYETKHLKFNTVKIMFDGTHRIHTAKLVTPYHDAETTGGTMLSEEKLYQLLAKLNAEGIDFHAHTVGEGASKMLLDCAERVKRECGGLKIHITLAHLETQRDEDIPRFAEMGIFANFTPHWHGGIDYGTAAENARLLGEERANKLFRAKTMVDSGATVTFSSDEVTLQLLDRWNPFLGIEIGHTRQDGYARQDGHACQDVHVCRETAEGGKGAAVFPPEEERLAVEDLIRGYTINGAKQLRLDDQIGSIEAGKRADLMVLDRDIFTVSPYEIHEMKPELVMVEGRVVRGKA